MNLLAVFRISPILLASAFVGVFLAGLAFGLSHEGCGPNAVPRIEGPAR